MSVFIVFVASLIKKHYNERVLYYFSCYFYICLKRLLCMSNFVITYSTFSLLFLSKLMDVTKYVFLFGLIAHKLLMSLRNIIRTLDYELEMVKMYNICIIYPSYIYIHHIYPHVHMCWLCCVVPRALGESKFTCINTTQPHMWMCTKLH